MEKGLKFGSYLPAIQSQIKIIYSHNRLFIEFLKVPIKQETVLDIGIIENTWKNGAFILRKKGDINQIIQFSNKGRWPFLEESVLFISFINAFPNYPPILMDKKKYWQPKWTH